MAHVENWNAELRSWLSPLLHRPSKPNPETLEPITIRPAGDVRALLEIEAKKRGVTLTELCSRLLYMAARDGLVGAVLDD
jgi:hypothetical protein